MKKIKTNILIVGGGAAGIAAACSASKQGAQVVLIDAHSFLGGSATAAEVGTICGLYHQKKSPTSEYIVSGFAQEFAEKLKSLSNSEPIVNRDGLHFLPYSISAYKMLCDNLLNDHNVRCLLSTKIVEIEVANKKAKSCIINQGENVIEIEFDAIIDCSGKSIVSRLANLPLIPTTNFQSAALVFSLKNVYHNDEQSLNFIIIKHLSKAISSGILSEEMRKLFIVPGSLKNESVSFKVGIPMEVTLSKNNLSDLKQKGLEMIQSFIRFLSSDIGAFENTELDHIAEDVGIRTDYRPIGKYILTEEDVIECRKFENAVANCSWPMEEWSNDIKVAMTYLPEGEFYQIPKESLVSAHLSNLYFGGKNISATDKAIASARVMGICFQTGFSAGILATKHVLVENYSHV